MISGLCMTVDEVLAGDNHSISGDTILNGYVLDRTVICTTASHEHIYQRDAFRIKS